MPTDLDLYSIFCTVARCGSLSHAARELYVSQPAISQSMHRLEYTLGCTLFTRTSRGISLTSEGRMLYSYADKAVSLIAAAEDKLNRMRTLQSGGLMIGASDCANISCCRILKSSIRNIRIFSFRSPTAPRRTPWNCSKSARWTLRL